MYTPLFFCLLVFLLKRDETYVLATGCSGRHPGVYPFPTNCSLYVLCDGEGNINVKVCKSNHHFHPEYKVCVWEQIYPCSGIMPNETSHVIISYCRKKAEGVYKDLKRCDSYVMCSKEGAYHLKCPAGLLFNSLTNKCDNATKVYCGGRHINPLSRIMTTSSSVPVSGTSAMKTKLAGGKRNTTNVPMSTNWKGTVQIKHVTGMPYSLAEEPTFSCEGMSPGKYAVNDACQYFYICTDKGEAALKKCPKHTNFHPVYRHCVWTYVYSCDDPKFCKERSDGRYQNPNNCYGYYQCAGGRTYPRNCDPGLRFNGNNCVDASKYICPLSPVTLNVVR